jgi:hypothetical protein
MVPQDGGWESISREDTSWKTAKESSKGFTVLDHLKTDFVFGTRRILARSALLRAGRRREELFLGPFITADLKVCSTPFRPTLWSLRLHSDCFFLDIKANKW